jgi:hypothetical protein
MRRGFSSPLRYPPRPAGKSRASPATRRAQAQASQTKTRPPGQAVLGHRLPTLAKLEELAPSGHARNCVPGGIVLVSGVLDHVCRVRKHVGGKRTSRQVRDLIFQMVAENPSWSAPRIHGQLLMLGFELSERTVSRWMRRTPRSSESGQRWLAFLRNHCEAIAAMDFFTVPTITFKLLYCFFINY